MITLGLDEDRRSERRSLDYSTFSSMGILAPPSTAGVTVSQATANTVSAYWNGVCVISGDIGVVGPPDLYKRGTGDEREKVTNDPVARVLANPNPETTPMQFWETITSHGVSWGGGYAEIEYDRAMRPIALWLIPPDCIEPKVDVSKDATGRKVSRVYYQYRGSQVLEKEDVFHVPGLGFDGVRGYSPVALARQSLGLSMAAERFGGSFFGGGAWPGLVVEHPSKITPEALERLQAKLNSAHGGSEKGNRTIVLDQGLKVSKPITIPPDDAQFLETRQFQIEEIARWLNLPPHKLKHKVNERPGGNFEASELDYTVTTLLPWARRITDECDRKLIAATRKARFYVEFNFAKRLKTDTATRMASYKSLYDMKVISEAQIAQKENLPVPEPSQEVLGMADQIEAVGQLIRAGFDPEGSLKAVGLPPIKHTGLPPVTVQGEDGTDAPGSPPVKQAPPTQESKARVAVAQQRAIGAALQRFVRREVEQMRRAAKKGPGVFGDRVEEFYSEGEAAVLVESLEPALDAAMAAMGLDGDARVVAQGFAAGYLERSKGELLSLKANEIEATVPATLKRWEGTRAAAGVDELMAALTAEEKEHVA